MPIESEQMPQLKLGRAGEAIRGGLLNFLEGGAPIRSGLAGLLEGDLEPLKQAIGYGQPFPQLTPEQMSSQAFDVAMDINNPMQNMGGLIGTFIGKGAKTWDPISHKKALGMAKKLVPERDIWAETGNFKGADGKWRQEIPDSMVFRPKVGTVEGRSYLSFDEAVNHPNLKKAYPQNADIDTIVEVGPEVRGSYTPPKKGDAYEFGRSQEISATGPSRKDIKSTLLHEQQHAIQELEGWAKGGSQRMMGNELGQYRELSEKLNDAATQALTTSDEIAQSNAMQVMDYYRKLRKPIDDLRGILSADEAYTKLAGEAESRATQARMNLTPQQRRALFPFDSYDVPRESLIIRGLLD